MTRILLLLCCLSVAGLETADGQRKPVDVSSWVTELAAGTALDLAARGPWIDSKWRQSFEHRVLLSVSASMLYEFVLEPWNGYTNAARFEDVGKRLAGTLVSEALIGWISAVVKKKL